LVSNGETTKAPTRTVYVKQKLSTNVKSDKPRSAPVTTGKKVKNCLFN
jgi:hypothetical protein